MGFCRRCGDIVVGTRCKCGGTAVAPVVPWNQSNSKEQSQDRWSKTYVSRDRSPSRSPSRGPSAINIHNTGSTSSTFTSSDTNSSSPVKRFPRPASTTVNTAVSVLGNRVSAHIASATSQLNRPPSPLKYSTTLPDPESDILPSPSPHTSTLSKVYGSVLQPKETLTTHSCAICEAPFPPDATIYPDPSAPSLAEPRFLCRSCFTTNGGSKGTCPTCTRPVLTLKTEGGFVQAAGQFWHKRCFNCEGCFKNIGDKPMVDLFGRPSCPECFDGCLNRDNTPKKWDISNNSSPRVDNLGGMSKGSKGAKSREASPAIEELEQRLGIIKSRESSPALEELGQRLSMVGRERASSPRGPLSRYSTAGKDGITNTSPLTSRYSMATTSREASPLMDLSRGRTDTRGDSSPSPVRRYERFRSPELEQHLQESIGSRMRSRDGGSESPSPIRYTATGSPAPTEEAIEEMKRRFMRGSSSSPAPTSPTSSPSTRITPLRPSRSSASLANYSRIPVAVSLSESTHNSAPHTFSRERDREEHIPPTPDLMSDFSDSTTQSSGPDSPPQTDSRDDVFSTAKVYGRGYGSRYTRGDFLDENGRRSNPGVGTGEEILEEEEGLGTPTPMPKSMVIPNSTPTSTPTKSSSTAVVSSPSPTAKTKPPFKPKPQSPHALTMPAPSPHLSASATCAKCSGALFAVREGGRFVTVPQDPGNPNSKPRAYHVECFRCVICEGAFKEGGKGQAIFVRGEGGPCHVECAPPEKVTEKRMPSSRSATSIPSPASSSTSSRTPALNSSSTSTYTSSRYDRPPLTAPVTSSANSFPRFGSTTACPGCHKSVALMERGVVPGPQGTRWHATCLVCGGKKEVVKGWGRKIAEERKKGEPGCGKRLDSAAKGDGEGGVWCRECLLLLPIGMRGSPQGSPTRSPLMPNPTGGGFGKVVPQFTGTTTIARQFTGLGGGDAALMRQLTGGGLSPTRQLAGSPTKQLGMRVRPKSVIGMRNTKSVDEGRGMFLVRQMTGGTGTGTGTWGE